MTNIMLLINKIVFIFKVGMHYIPEPSAQDIKVLFGILLSKLSKTFSGALLSKDICDQSSLVLLMSRFRWVKLTHS